MILVHFAHQVLLTLFAQIGAGIQLPPNATKLLRSWGVLEEIQRYALQAQDVNIRTYRRGDTLLRLDFGASTANEFNGPYLLVHRADLHAVLLRRAQDLGVEFKLNAVVNPESIDVSKGSVALSNGEAYTGDVILGAADGEKSICRDMLLGRQDNLLPTGDTIFRISLKISDLLQADDLSELVQDAPINYWMGPNSHCVSYVMTKGESLNLVLTAQEDNTNSRPHGIQRAEVPELRLKFRDWNPQIKKLLELTEKCSTWSLMHSEHNERWIHPSGNLLLIGDSAHAMLPYLSVLFLVLYTC